MIVGRALAKIMLIFLISAVLTSTQVLGAYAEQRPLFWLDCPKRLVEHVRVLEDGANRDLVFIHLTLFSHEKTIEFEIYDHYLAFLAVWDLDGPETDDEHVTFQLKWYYEQVDRGGPYPPPIIRERILIRGNYPNKFDDGKKTISLRFGSCNFVFHSRKGLEWNVKTVHGYTSATTTAVTKWLTGPDYGFRTRAITVKAGGYRRHYGTVVQFRVMVEYERRGRGEAVLAWYYPACILSL